MSLPLSGKRIGLLTASASRAGGGVFEAVVAQAALIRTLGAEALVFALDDADAERDRHRFGLSPVSLAQVYGPRQIGFAPRLGQMLIDAQLDCLHLHGIWTYPSRAGSAWARATGRAFVISPHGMLDPWITARGRWKKVLARRGYERTGWARASVLHALTEHEAADIARETGRGDSVIIPNALPPTYEDFPPPDFTTRPPVVAYLGRIHPKKNLLALVEGWGQAARPVGARLLIAGWGDAPDVDALRRAIALGDAQADGSIEFLGPVFGGAKADLLRSARFMVLPSLSEGLPMAMLEAWASATPTVMTAACNLDEGFAAGAAIQSGYRPSEIAAALGRGLALGEHDWQAMAGAALALAQGRFAADVVAASWAAAYTRAIELGATKEQ
jgi:poly(glycerol-phosphate) alpha-glucosyltransferase